MPQQSRPDFIASLAAGVLLAPAGSSIALAEWEAAGTPPGEKPMRIAPLHLHLDDDEAWYVLEGTLDFQIGDAVFTASAGEAVVAPKGTPHTYWNASNETSRYLIVMPGQIQPLIAAIHQAERRDEDSMRALFRQYGAELLAWYD